MELFLKICGKYAREQVGRITSLYNEDRNVYGGGPVVSRCRLSVVKVPDMTNVEIKLKLRESCVKMKGTESGWGMLHVGRLLGCDKVFVYDGIGDKNG